MKISIDEVREVFDELKESIEQFYSKYAELDTDGVIDMGPVLRNCSKMELFLDGDYKELYLMEQEDRRRLAKQLESIPVETVKDQEVQTKERRDSCSSMPPLESFNLTQAIENYKAMKFDDMPHVCDCTSSCLVEEANEVIATNPQSLYTSPTPIQAPSPVPIVTPNYYHVRNLINPIVTPRIWLPQNGLLNTLS